ncbi:MAG: pyrroloquinoline-quinone synthase PqqC [Myxococcota bacterium]|nr:pyrroloquinoline-quinone synthase PqqC [Myxococcota bacterium]
MSQGSGAELSARIREILAERYHDKHPFNLRMQAGELTREELQRWVRNRYYYQTRIPIKDGLILTKAEDPSFRRGWIRRIHDHDGERPDEGGLALWLDLAEAVGLDRDEVASLRQVLPGVRRACDAYVSFVEGHDLLESVASSLTEIAAGPYLGARADAFEKHYAWIAPEGLAYFRSRTQQAPRDAQEGLDYVLAHAQSEEDRQRAAEALEQKCEILWSLLDGVEWGGRRPALSPAARWQEDGMLVLPERAIRLGSSAREILDACDGERTADDVATALRTSHPEEEHIERDVFEFLEQMERLGVVRMLEPEPLG